MSAGRKSRDSGEVRSVVRALSVLRQLNIENGATIRDLHRSTGISRAALYRILRTLQAEGYIASDSDVEAYRLTPMVRQLSEGFNEELMDFRNCRPASR